MSRFRTAFVIALASATLLLAAWSRSLPRAQAIGDATDVDLRIVDYKGADPQVNPTAMKRLAWEVRQRTSVTTRLEPLHTRLSDPRAFESPFLYWTGAAAFPALSEAESQGLRRFVELGGFVMIDDASPHEDDELGFDRSVRRELARAFGTTSLVRVPDAHVLFRSFYLVQKPLGRFADPTFIEGVERNGRFAVVYSRQNVGGALERDNLGNYAYALDPQSREMAARLGVNFVLYALCLDYKDDQVHAPFILRRWAGRP